MTDTIKIEATVSIADAVAAMSVEQRLYGLEFDATIEAVRNLWEDDAVLGAFSPEDVLDYAAENFDTSKLLDHIDDDAIAEYARENLIDEVLDNLTNESLAELLDDRDYDFSDHVDTDDFLSDVGTGKLIDHLIESIGYDGIAGRLYDGCSMMRDAMIEHADACELAVDIMRRDKARFAAHVKALDRADLADLRAVRDALNEALYEAEGADPAPDTQDLGHFLTNLTTDQQKEAVLWMVNNSEAVRVFAREQVYQPPVGGDLSRDALASDMEPLYRLLDTLPVIQRRSTLNHLTATTPTEALSFDKAMDAALTLPDANVKATLTYLVSRYGGAYVAPMALGIALDDRIPFKAVQS